MPEFNDFDELDDLMGEITEDDWIAGGMALVDDGLSNRLAGTPWHERAEQIDEDTPLADRIKFYQELRAAQALPEDVTYFLVCWAIELLADERLDEAAEKIYDPQFEAIYTQHGVTAESSEVWDTDGGGPEEYYKLSDEFDQAATAIYQTTYREFGEEKLFEFNQAHPDDAQARYDTGYEYLATFDLPPSE